MKRNDRDEDIVNCWNAGNPPGTPVVVRKDDGSLFRTTTRSAALVLGGHTPVVMLDGIAGCYLLSRVTPANLVHDDKRVDPGVPS